MPFTAGQYVASYNAQAMGISADGFRLNHQFFKRLIQGDYMAETVQDSVYRGMELLMAGTLIQYKAAAVQEILWPYGTAIANNIVGLFDVQNGLCKQIVLTSVIVAATVVGSGTVGSTNAPSPITRTLPRCILQEGYPVELLFAPDLREVPIRFRVYPHGTTGVFGTDT